MNKIELLAPAGNLLALKAAVENGADAVYLGGQAFSARKNADNFDAAALSEGISYAHARQVKVYAAVNTLINNQEIGEFLSYAYELAASGIDAVIVQDLGAAHLLHHALPELRLHGSTQMAVHNSAGVRFAKELGFKRIVLARETSLADIQSIIREDIMEIETFVHGALCVAYSGQCLLSSMIGGRSGNRGQCAQPCRQRYTLIDRTTGQAFTEPAEGKYLLSTRDLMLLHELPALIDAGITSLKIEGRMKRPEYVATIVKHYRTAIDQYAGGGALSKQADHEIRQIFNRDFTTGYYFGNPGRELMSYPRPDNRGIKLGDITYCRSHKLGVKLSEPLNSGDGYLLLTADGQEIAGQVNEFYCQGQRRSQAAKGDIIELQLSKPAAQAKAIYKTSDALLLKQAAASYSTPSEPHKKNLYLHLTAKLGQPLQLRGWDDDHPAVQAQSDYIAELAQKHASSWEDVRKQLDRLGNTAYRLERLEGDLDEGIMVPASELNKLRREIIDQLERSDQPQLRGQEEFWEAAGDLLDRIPPQVNGYAAHLLSVAVSSLACLRAAVDAGADRVIANMTAIKGHAGFQTAELSEAAAYCHEHGSTIYLTVSAIANEAELDRVREWYQQAKQAGFDGILAANAGTFRLAQEAGWTTIAADYPMNIFNDAAIQCLSEAEVSQVTLSPELNLHQIADFAYIGNVPTEVLIHGNFPLMISEQCVLGSVLGGRSAAKACQAPCLSGTYGLKDRLGMVFPVYTDRSCRMLIYNCKTLNLYKRLEDVLKTGVDIIRIESRERSAQWIAEVTAIYRQALDQYMTTGKITISEKTAQKLDALDPEGSTYGHYFRGVQ